MSDTTTAELLRIGEGFVVWVVGTTVEETSLLDPLPEGAEVIEVRDEDDPERVDAAILVTDDRTALTDDLDEVVPQLGSIPVVWIAYPLDHHGDLDEDALQTLVADYGWEAAEHLPLDDTWAAMRIVPD